MPPKRSDQGGPGTSSVRLTSEAAKWARVASGYTGESLAAYCSRVVAERARADARELHRELVGQADAPISRRRRGAAVH